MLKADFFARFGMLVVEDFLEPRACRKLRQEVRASATVRASVWKDGEKVVDEEARRTTRATVRARTTAFVERRLLAARPKIESHFGLKLRGIQTPQFLIYRPGDFFERHVDNDDDRSAPRYIRERRISAVVFLNGKTRRNGKQVSTGGGLTFPGLIDHPRLESRDFRVLAEGGLLIAFRSDVEHAVSPVTRGARYTVVSWYV